MNCQDVQEKWLAHRVGELGDAEATGLRQHLETCAACRAAAEETERILDLMRSAFAAGPAAPARLDKRHRNRVLRAQFTWAGYRNIILQAAAVLLVSIVMIGLLLPATMDAYSIKHCSGGVVELKLAEANTPPPATPAPDAAQEFTERLADPGAAVKSKDAEHWDTARAPARPEENARRLNLNRTADVAKKMDASGRNAGAFFFDQAKAVAEKPADAKKESVSFKRGARAYQTLYANAPVDAPVSTAGDQRDLYRGERGSGEKAAEASADVSFATHATGVAGPGQAGGGGGGGAKLGFAYSDAGGVGGLNKSGAGTLTLEGANSYSGGTTLNGGILVVAGQASQKQNMAIKDGDGVVTLTGGALNWQGAAVSQTTPAKMPTSGPAAAEPPLNVGGVVAGVPVQLYAETARGNLAPLAPLGASSATPPGKSSGDLSGWAEGESRPRAEPARLARLETDTLVPLRTELPKPMLAGTPSPLPGSVLIIRNAEQQNERLREISKAQPGDSSGLQPRTETAWSALAVETETAKKLEDHRKSVVDATPTLGVVTAPAPVRPATTDEERRDKELKPATTLAAGETVTFGGVLAGSGGIAGAPAASAAGRTAGAEQHQWFLGKGVAKADGKDRWGFEQDEKGQRETAVPATRPPAQQLARSNRAVMNDDFAAQPADGGVAMQNQTYSRQSKSEAVGYLADGTRVGADGLKDAKAAAPAKPTGGAVAQQAAQALGDVSENTVLSLDIAGVASAPVAMKGLEGKAKGHGGYFGRFDHRADADFDANGRLGEARDGQKTGKLAQRPAGPAVAPATEADKWVSTAAPEGRADAKTALGLEFTDAIKSPVLIKGVATAYARRFGRADQRGEADGDRTVLMSDESDAKAADLRQVAQAKQTELGRVLHEDRELDGRKEEKAAQHKKLAEESITSKPIFRAAGVNPFVQVNDQSFSTFSISVDSASFTLARRYLNGGQRPPPESVRTEEFVNYFDYGYAPPGRDLFSVHAAAARTPFCPPGVHLLKLGIKGRQAGREDRGANLTFLLDTSGSMNAPDRLGLARDALKLLVAKLGPRDRVALVTFSSRARLALDFTPASEQKKIFAALDGIQAAGFTHLEGGLKLAYETAARGFVAGAANRVILMSDGVANVGADAAAELLAQVERYRKQGLFCSVFGLGTGTYDDTMLQALASKGNGTYLFMDSPDEARRVFVDEFAATVNKIAADVKIQVEFNPRRVKQYRQLGYEQRQLKTEDFRNDAVAAGEVGSGQSVTALYQVELQGDAREPLGTVRVRGRNLETGRVEELERAITAGDLAPSFERADVRFQLAAAAAQFAEILRGSPYAEGASCGDVAKALRPVALELNLDQKVQELLRLVNAAGGAPQASE